MSVRTIALTLKQTEAEAAALARLQAAFNEACNYVSGVAWDAQEFNSVRLHRLTYYDIRATYGLLAQHAVRAIGVVAISYKADKSKRHTFKPTAAVCLDTPRLYRIDHNRAGIATLDGRVKVELKIGGIQRRQLAATMKLAEADLVRDHKGRWRLLVSAHYADPPVREADEALGVDLGRTDIAVTSDGEAFSGERLTALRDRYARNRRIKQHKASKGTRTTRRRARAVQQRLAGRERRMQANVNHTISKHLVATAVDTGKAIALEDLAGIRERTNKQARGKGERRRANSWAFYQLRCFVAYKCAAAGVPFVLVNPAFTSQMCHCCLHIGERSGKWFRCPDCGWSGDADYNGAANIAQMGTAVIRPRGPWLSCPVAGSPQGS